MKLRRALLSVHDKTGLAEFARGLREHDIELVAFAGTEQFLIDEGLPVVSLGSHLGVEHLTATDSLAMHPRLHQALAARRGGGDGGTLTADDDLAFDIVVANLHPFERVSSRRDSRESEVVEAIDLVGPTLLRAAAKDYEHVLVIADPEVYPIVLEEIAETHGDVSYDLRRLLASRAFDATAHYELAVANWFSEIEDFPTYLLRDYVKMTDLPHGENPHQRAALYVEVGARRHLLSRVEQLQGEDLGFNNLNDLNTARGVAGDFTIPSCVIVKHASPVGCAVSGDGRTAFERASACDPDSIGGGVIALNRPVDGPTAEAIVGGTFEVLFAPDYTDEARTVLAKNTGLRVLADRERRTKSPGERDMRRVIGGLLVQDMDSDLEERDNMDVAGRVQPTEQQWGDLLFAWRVAKWVPSNAVVLAHDLMAVGIGGCNPSRHDGIEFALKKAGDRAAGSMMASDAFLSYEDTPQTAINAGIAGIIQPGGSDRDDEIIALADAAGIPMVFTNRRHFRH